MVYALNSEIRIGIIGRKSHTCLTTDSVYRKERKDTLKVTPQSKEVSNVRTDLAFKVWAGLRDIVRGQTKSRRENHAVTA